MTVFSGSDMVMVTRNRRPVTGLLQQWSVIIASHLRGWDQVIMTLLSPDAVEEKSVWAKLSQLSERMRGLDVGSEEIGQTRRKRSTEYGSAPTSYPYFTFNEWVSNWTRKGFLTLDCRIYRILEWCLGSLNDKDSESTGGKLTNWSSQWTQVNHT